MEANELLRKAYGEAMRKASGGKAVKSALSGSLRASLDTILRNAEQQKGVYTVVLTSVAYKILHPEQDIRKHQTSIPGGYSGRTFDGHYVTPFLKEKEFPAMAESGWLTRSLEQKVPYDKNYTGAIKEPLKSSFLEVLHKVQTGEVAAEIVLDYMLQGLIIQRDAKAVALATPHNLSIKDIVRLLDVHFHRKYKAHGASRLPVLALYALYELVVGEMRVRYKGKRLLPLESHTSADSQSGRMGDIDIVNADGTPFEAVEVKFDIPVSCAIVETAKRKIEKTGIERYYILSTKEIAESESKNVEQLIKRLGSIHGCQMVVNGVMPTLKYYLRLVDDTAAFIDKYVALLAADKSIMFEHKAAWNDLVSNL